MAIVEETIGTGKDRATVTLWESNAGAFGTDTYKGIIQEDANFDEHVTLTGGSGTPSVTSYLWLTTDPANRHAGVAGTGHGRMNVTTPGHVLIVDSNFCRIEGLEIKQDQTGSSDEGIRVGAYTDVLIQSNIIWTDSGAVDQDGVYQAGAGTGQVAIDNCLIYGWTRSAVHNQNSPSGVFFVDHCGLESNDTTDTEDAGYFQQQTGSTGSLTIYNSWLWHEGADRTALETESINWPVSGTHNLTDTPASNVTVAGTDSTTNWQDASSGIAEVTKSSGSWLVLVDIDVNSQVINGLLLDAAAGNLAAGNGTDRQGSEPDTRQDFSVDITGSVRPTTGVDIGPHQVTISADPAAPTVIELTGSIPLP